MGAIYLHVLPLLAVSVPTPSTENARTQAKGQAMTDLEITKACAEAMGLAVEQRSSDFAGGNYWALGSGEEYDPLHDDAQAMALVKIFGLHIYTVMGDRPYSWVVHTACGPTESGRQSENLNRAICECVALMQEAKR